MSVLDLCTVADVTSYVPGYVSEALTDAVLARLVTSESESVIRESGRELKTFRDQPETRSFLLDTVAVNCRILHIGDLADAGDTDITVELLDANEANPVTVDRIDYRPLYRLRRQPTEVWEPITAIELLRGAGTLTIGRTILVTGNWGFPMVPSFIREATAKRVILRYVSDVASSGTTFADSIDNLNLAGLFASARDAVQTIGQKVLIR